MTELPSAWKDLMEALTLLSQGQVNGLSPFHCEHDKLTVMADPARFTAEDIAHLEILGFHPDDDETFYSFRFGSA